MNRSVTYIRPCSRMWRSMAQEKSEIMVPTSPNMVRTISSRQGFVSSSPPMEDWRAEAPDAVNRLSLPSSPLPAPDDALFIEWLEWRRTAGLSFRADWAAFSSDGAAGVAIMAGAQSAS